MSRLGLGTVQFGFNYGVSNNIGRPDAREIAAILARAADSGLVYLDTAIGYGDAETLIGRHAPPSHQFRIVTKTPRIPDEKLRAHHAADLISAVDSSCGRLRSDHLYGLLLHDVHDLAKPGSEFIVEALQEVQRRGLVKLIGASVYDADGLALVASKFAPQLVQLPLNVLDRRLVDCGWLSRLKEMGTEIHARSVFLQGLLLMKPSDLPAFFDPLKASLSSLSESWSRQHVNALVAALGFVVKQKELDAVIVGVNCVEELTEIENAMAIIERVVLDYGPSLPVDQKFLNPALWPAAS